MAADPATLVSIVIPIHNAAATLLACLDSCARQTHAALEVCACDDASSDASLEVLRGWAAAHARIPVRLHAGRSGGGALGPAAARNRAASLARGAYLCLLDADDEMLPCRVALQLAAAARHPGALIGASFVREPADATPRYAAWANGLTDDQLLAQAWRECTLLQPTWFLAREAFVRLGGYDEVGPVLCGEAPPPYAFPCLALDPCAEAAAAAAGGAESGSAASADGAAASADGAAATACNSTEAAAAAAAAPAAAAALAAQPPAHAPILSRAPLKFRPECLAGAPGAPPLPAAFTPFPEDPLFFHRHLAAAAAARTPLPLHRVPTPCLIYRYSASSLTWRVSRNVLLACKTALFEERVMCTRPGGSGGGGSGGGGSGGGAARWWIWGAGRDGKAFYKALSPRGRAQCAGFLDLDPGKVGQCYPPPVGRGRKRAREGAGGEAAAAAAAQEPLQAPLPILHFSSLGAGAQCAPGQCCVAVCVALDSGGQELLDNVQTASRALQQRGGGALQEGANLFFLC